MELQALVDYVSSLEGVAGLQKDKTANGTDVVKFIFREAIDVSLNADTFDMQLNVTYNAKLFANAKINKAFMTWAKSILDIPAELETMFFVVNVGNAHVFNIHLAEGILDAIPEVINSFLDEFLPSIKTFIKG